MPLSRKWDQMPVWGFYDATGEIHLTVTERIRRSDGLMIYPGGKTAKVTIGNPDQQDPAAKAEVRAALRAQYVAADSLPEDEGPFDDITFSAWWDARAANGVFLYFYLTDDPDITPNGWQVKVEERLSNGTGKVFYVQTLSALLAQPVPGINLGDVEVPPGSPTAPAPVYAKGQPGGIAALDVDGDVVNAAGAKVLGGGVSTVDGLTDASDVGKAVVTAADAATARDAIGAVAGDDTRLGDQRVPVDGSVTLAKLTAALQAAIAKANASLDQAAVDARVQLVVDSAPAALDTLNELSAALGDDPNFAATVLGELAGKVPTTRTVAGKALSADVTLVKADVGLGSVDDTADVDKPLSTATTAALATKMPLSGQRYVIRPATASSNMNRSSVPAGHVGPVEFDVTAFASYTGTITGQLAGDWLTDRSS